MRIKRTVTIKITKLIAYFVSFALIGAAILVAYWFVQPTNVLEIYNDPVPVYPPAVGAGEGRINLFLDYCKLREAKGTVKVFMVGENHGQKPELVWPEDSTPKGCVNSPIDILIPGSVQTDTYHIVFEVRYNINPFKDSELTVFRTRSFQVINEKLQPGDAKPQP